MRRRLPVFVLTLLVFLLSFGYSVQAAVGYNRVNVRNWAYANINNYNGDCTRSYNPCQCTEFVAGGLAAGGLSGPNFSWIGNQYLVKWMWEHPDQWAFIDPHNTEPGDFILYSRLPETNRRNWSDIDPTYTGNGYRSGASVNFVGWSRFGHTALVVENGGIVADWNNSYNAWTAHFDDKNSGYNFAVILGIHVRDGNPSSFNPYSQIKGASFSASYDTQLESTADAGGGLDVAFISSGSYLRFDNVNFGSTGAISVQLRAAGYNAGGQINFRIGSPSAAPFATVIPRNTNGWQTWVTETSTIPARPTGNQTVYVTFENSPHVNINWFQFVQGSAVPAAPQIISPASNALVPEGPAGDLGVRMLLNVQLLGTGPFALQLSNGTGRPFVDMYPVGNGAAGIWGNSPMNVGIPMSTDGTYTLRAKSKNAVGESGWSATVTFRVVKVATPTPTPVPTRVPPTPTPAPTVNPCLVPENRGGMGYGVTYELAASCRTRSFSFTASSGPIFVDAQPRGATRWQYRMDLFNSAGVRVATAHSSFDSRAILMSNVATGSYRLDIVVLSGQGPIGVALYTGYGALSFRWMQSAYYDMTFWRYNLTAGGQYYVKFARTDGNLEYTVRITNANGQQIASANSRNGNLNLPINNNAIGWFNVYITMRAGTSGSYSAGLFTGSAPAY